MLRFLAVVMIFCFSLLSNCANNNVNEIAKRTYANHEFEAPLPPHEFKSDGCSCWPDYQWVECCVEHDLLYWMGGTRDDRKTADEALQKCVAEKGYPVIGAMMYVGVRVGGVYWLPTPFRWGFGWDYPQHGPPGVNY